MKNRKELQIIFGFAIAASAQFNLEKVAYLISNGMSIPTMKTNQNATGAKEPDSAHLTKFFKNK